MSIREPRFDSSTVISRRGLLQRAAAAGTALVAPHIATGPLLGANAPSNRIHVAQIGCGNIGVNYHIPALSAMPDVRIVAVADAFKSRRETAAAKLNEKYGDPKAVTPYADFKDILARSDVDAVIIGVHDNWHVPMSIAAAKAGKDVYCQKPLALDFSLAKPLREVIRDKKRVFQFGTQYRSEGPYGLHRRMCQLVRNGYIGKLQRIDVWSRHIPWSANPGTYGSTQVVPVPADLDFDAWMGPSEMVPYTVDRTSCWGGYHCPETSLGFIAGCGVHELGLAQWANKSDHTSPVRYFGSGMLPAAGVYQTLARWDVACEYANGVKMRYMDSQTALESIAASLPKKWYDMDGVVFHGTDGWVSDAMGYCASDQGLWKVPFKPGDEELMISPEHNRNFIDCVKSRQEPICPVEMAIRCDTICHLCDIAARTGRAIQWNPEKEEIVGDDAAAKMLKRPFREKWKVW